MNYLLGPQRPAEAGRKTLVLDLDETLVHSSFKHVDNADITLNVDIEGQLCTIYVLVRPFVK
jgi:RNA polymerase II subunit A small phosphatase-like protein